MATKTDKRTISIEVQRPGPAPDGRRASASDGVHGRIKEVIQVNLKEWMKSLQDTVEDVRTAFTPKPGGPDTTEVRFGVNVDAKGKAVLAEVGAAVMLEVKLVWKREAETGAPQP